MDAATAQLYGVLLVQGSLWVLGHCPGMCGPLVVGLRFPGALSLLAYQGGKAVTYALLGALAGWVGGWAVLGLRVWAPVLLLAVAVVMVVAGIRGLRGRGAGSIPVPAWLSGAIRRWSAGRGGPFLLGLVLAFLPCAVVVWTLGLSVASASPLHGALLAIGLVALNTPVLLAVHLLAAGAWMAALRARLRWLPPLGLILAGLWLAGSALLIGQPGCVP